MPLQEARHVLQHAIARVVAERVVDRLEPIDVDEQQRHREVEPPVPLQLAVHHLLEEPAVVATGQRIGDRRLQQLLARRLEASVRHPQLVGHVLEHELMDAERAERVEHGVDGRDLEHEFAARQHPRDEHRRRHVGDRETEHHERDETGAYHVPLDHDRGVQRAGRGQKRRRDEEPEHERARRTERNRDDDQQNAERRQRLQAVRLHVARVPVHVGAPEVERRAAYAEKLRGADGRARRRDALVAAREQQHHRHDQAPAGEPQQDERLAPVRVLKREQSGDDRRAERGRAAWADRNVRRRGNALGG